MDEILDAIRRSVCAGYSFENIGIGEYLVHTDMYYDDGDELHIVMKKVPTGIMLTDEGHTLMWLSYEDFKFTDTRRRLLDKYIDQNNVRLDDGRIHVEADSPEHVGPALSSLIQAMLQVACLRNLSRTNVVNSFAEDVRSAFSNSDLAGRCVYGKRIPVDKGDFVEPDIFIDSDSPVLLFIAGGSERAKEVVINLMLAKQLDTRYRTVVVIDDDSNISKKDRERLVNTAERPIIGTDSVVPLTESIVRT